MKKIYEVLVRVVYFFTWPLTGLVLHNSNRVRVLVTSKNKILLQKTSYGLQKWSVPGGGVDRGESTIDAAVREMYEETGIVAPKASLEQIGKRSVANNRLGWPKMNVTFYHLECAPDVHFQIRHPLEIIELSWFSASTLPADISPTVTLARELCAEYESAQK